ncbi:MAG: YeeE/YedE family protein [Bacteroidota bacterium]
MTDFSPWSALAGGALIGAGAVLLMLANGRILGIAGIVGGLIGEGGRDLAWRLAFVAGMVTPGIALGLSGNLHLQGNGLGAGLLVLSGLLVGFGTRMGNGCTSGHGICGLARLSPRSLASVVTFMAVAGIVVFVRRHLMGA